MPALPVVPRALARILVIASIALLAWMNRSVLGIHMDVAGPLYFKVVLWENRLLDVLLQIVLIFAGVLGVLGLMDERSQSHSAEAAAHAGAQEGRA